jgi:predicted Fe-Mo cluster-binding NifX family protein
MLKLRVSKRRYHIMRAVISAADRSPEAKVDPRFGRAKFFAVCDTETKEFSFKDNGVNLTAAQGAGIQSAKNAADLGAEAVITGHTGPKAFAALKAAGIKVFTAGPDLSVREAAGLFAAGKLKELADADVDGHWV